MTTYMVCDEDGYALTDGLQGPEICDEARKVAQSIANQRLESVWLSPSDSSELGEEFEPDEDDAVVAARLALREWEPDEATEADIAAVFAAIYERPPEIDEDAVGLIYAAQVTADEAARINKVI